MQGKLIGGAGFKIFFFFSAGFKILQLLLKIKSCVFVNSLSLSLMVIMEVISEVV